MSKIGYVLVFIGFLWPMTAVLALSLYSFRPFFWSAIAITSISIAISILIVIYFERKNGGVVFNISSYTPSDKDLISYVISFMPIFIISEIVDAGDILALLAFFIIFAFVVILSGAYFLNVIFLLMGWRVYEASIGLGSGRRCVTIIARGDRNLNSGVANLVRVGNTRVYIEPRE